MPQNKLADSKSPYLQQHANNPVNWYPWNQEALDLAKKTNKPILLSIGYAACHWCHVMAHESFEDEDTAAIMNKYFINIKVDREERPDLDKIYQTAHQLLNRQGGGWPLTTFLTPDDQTPFFSGTYFPKTARYGMPAFKDLLDKIAEIYRLNFKDITHQNTQLQLALSRLTQQHQPSDNVLTEEPIELALDAMEEEFDEENGGFGDAPKFPLTMNLQRLLRRTHDYPRDQAAIRMLEKTLTKMAEGGIYDQLGGGFYRYSVDAQWMIPHFEKMLYDNALLIAVYARAYILLKNELYKHIANETLAWVFRMMQHPQGGFYATLDADTCGIEGKYYYWELAEIKKILSPQEFKLFSLIYGLDGPSNFEKYYHLYQKQSLAHWSPKEKKIINAAKEKLLIERRKRIRPGLDDTILTSWNSLMLRALTIAGLIFRDQTYLISAEMTLEFLKKNLWRKGKLYACFKDGNAYQPAFLDDYAFLLDAILYALQIKWSTDHLNFAITIADELLAHFEDKQNGGFFYTSDYHEKLIQRPKTYMDEALPSGNGIAAHALNRLGHLLGEIKYIEAAERTLKSGWNAMIQIPSVHNSLIHALEEFLRPPTIVIIRGKPTIIKKWQQKLIQEKYNPHRLIFCISDTETDLPKFLENFRVEPRPVAYLCEGNVCLPPFKSLDKLLNYSERDPL